MAEAKIHGCLCRNCGIELVTHSKSADTYCRFCGAPALVAQDYDDITLPELVIPFEVDKHRARRTFLQHLSKRPLSLSALTHKAKSGNFSAVYVPVCLNDIEMQTDISLSEGSTTVTSCAKDVFINAGTHISPGLFSLLGPFDFSTATQYGEEHHNIPFEKHANFEERTDELTEEIKVQAIAKAKEALGQDSPARFESCTHSVTHSSRRFALVPLWILSHPCKGYSQQLFINGQSGKIIGEIPPSISRIAALFGIIAAGCTVIGELIWMAVK